MLYSFGEGYLLFLNVLTITCSQTDETGNRKTKTIEFCTKAQFTWFLVPGTRPRIMIYGNCLRNFSRTITYCIFHTFNICLIRYSKPSFLLSWYSKAKNPWLRFYYHVLLLLKWSFTLHLSRLRSTYTYNGMAMTLAYTTQLANLGYLTVSQIFRFHLLKNSLLVSIWGHRKFCCYNGPCFEEFCILWQILKERAVTSNTAIILYYIWSHRCLNVQCRTWADQFTRLIKGLS